MDEERWLSVTGACLGSSLVPASVVEQRDCGEKISRLQKILPEWSCVASSVKQPALSLR